MRHFLLFFGNFLSRAFEKKSAYLLHFAAPPAAFLAMFLLLRSSGDEAFAGTQALGLIVYFTMIQAVLVSSLAMKDREEGVMDRILASPAPRAAYAAGNGAAAYLVLAAQVLLSAELVSFAFPVKLGLSFPALLCVLMAFAAASVGFAFLICALNASSSGAMISANVIIMFSSLMGGSFFPVEFMQPWMRALAFAFPQYWAMRALRQAQAGSPAAGFGFSLLVLALFALLFFALQAAVRRRESSPA